MPVNWDTKLLTSRHDISILQPHNLDHNETGDHLLGTKAQYGNVTTFKTGLKALISLFHLRDTTANAVGFLKKNFVSSLKKHFHLRMMETSVLSENQAQGGDPDSRIDDLYLSSLSCL